MKKHKSLLLLPLLAFTLTGCGSGFFSIDNPIFDIILLILIPMAIVGIMVAINKALHSLSIKVGFVYWPLCLAMATILFFVLKDQNNPGLTFGTHLVLWYLLVPMMDGNTEYYWSVSVQTNFWGDEYLEEQLEESYTPGWLRKLILAGVCAGVATLVNWLATPYMWIVFLVEGLYSGYLALVAIIARIKASKQRSYDD